MFYVELLRVRNGLIGAIGILILLMGLTLVVMMSACPSCRTTITTSYPQSPYPLIGYIAAILAAIFGSGFGASLAIENDGHLPLTWTKPIARGAQAIGILLIDIAGILAAFGLSFAAGWFVVSALARQPYPAVVPFDTPPLVTLARFLAFPVAMFGSMQALTAGIKGSWQGAVIGPFWAVCQGLLAIGLLPLSPPLHKIWQIANLPNPLAYFPFWGNEYFYRVYELGYGDAIDALALAAIACVGVTIATLRWRRLEA